MNESERAARAANDLHRAINVLAKWRVLFAGWQLGTRLKGDPECEAVKNHRELSIILRAEVTALTGLLIEKGVFSQVEFTEALTREAVALNRDYEQRFPGVRADESGLIFGPEAVKTMEGWKR